MQRKVLQRRKRHLRIRNRIIGTSERPRLCVYKSLKHMYVQIIDDIVGKTLLGVSTLSKEFRQRVPEYKNNVESAGILGEIAGRLALERGIEKVVFDRAGYKYHGKVKAIADGARRAGLKF